MKKNLLNTLFLFSSLLSFISIANNAMSSTTKAATNLLFIQAADQGSLKPLAGQPGYYLLTLSGVKEYIEYFSDRPVRVTGLYPTKKFLSYWESGTKANSFNKMPPNAALSAIELHLLKNKMVNKVLQLSNPSYNPKSHTLTYTVKPLPGVGNNLTMTRLEHVVLFIDNYCASCAGHGF